MLPLRVRMNLGAMETKECSAFPKAPALLEPHHQIFLVSYSEHSLRRGILLLCREAVGKHNISMYANKVLLLRIVTWKCIMYKSLVQVRNTKYYKTVDKPNTYNGFYINISFFIQRRTFSDKNILEFFYILAIEEWWKCNIYKGRERV